MQNVKFQKIYSFHQGNMDRWKQRHSLNLDNRSGLNYLSKIFGHGNNHASSKDVSNLHFNASANGKVKNRHYAGLQPLSPCWELSDSFSHSNTSTIGENEKPMQVSNRREINFKADTPKRPFSICGPIPGSHYPNYSIPSPSQTQNIEYQPTVQLRQKKKQNFSNRLTPRKFQLSIIYLNIQCNDIAKKFYLIFNYNN